VSRFDAIRGVAGEPSVILDVGANVGRTVRRFRKEFPRAAIHAFEPHPELAGRLRALAATMDGVSVHECAVGDRVGRASFHLNRFDANHSLLPQGPEAARWARIDHVREVDVETTTVDAFRDRAGLPAIGLVKIDADGGDLMVLEGARRSLAERRIGAVLVELLYVPIFDGQPHAHDIERFLLEAGYWLFDHYQPRYDASGRIRASNGLFFPEVKGRPRAARATRPSETFGRSNGG
jgi:FkbM family methyltransferase